MRRPPRQSSPTKDKPAKMGTSSVLSVAIPIIITFGVLSGVAVIVVVVLLMVKFRAALSRLCCPMRYDEESESTQAPKNLNNNSDSIQTNRAEVNTVNELDDPTEDDAVYNRSHGNDEVYLVANNGETFNVSSSDIEKCRDGECVEAGSSSFGSLSDLTGILDSILNGKMTQLSSPRAEDIPEETGAQGNGSLLPMTPEQHRALINVEATDPLSGLDRSRHSPSETSPKEDCCQTLESDVSCELPALKPMDVTDTGDRVMESDYAKSAESRAETEADSFRDAPEYEERLDYESFINSLGAGEEQLVISSDTEDEDVAPRVPAADVLGTVYSTPRKTKDNNKPKDHANDSQDCSAEFTNKQKLFSNEVTIKPADIRSSSDCCHKESVSVTVLTGPVPEQSRLIDSDINQWQGNSTCEMLQSYINISITPEGPEEKIHRNWHAVPSNTDNGDASTC